MAAYGVTQHGNFEGKNILEFEGDLDQRATLAEARRKLFETRGSVFIPAATRRFSLPGTD
jgi:uncharacterized protein YyaL (SSP411 family)